MKTWRGHINKTRKGEERLKCPFCNAADTKVIDSRPADDNSSIRRRRQCETCGKRFTTYEKLETIPLMVVKKDNTREMYDRAKIEAGILHSCHKRPVSPGQISALIDDVENNLFNREEREISTAVIGELVMERLKDLDVVTYVRYTGSLKTSIHLWRNCRRYSSGMCRRMSLERTGKRPDDGKCVLSG